MSNFRSFSKLPNISPHCCLNRYRDRGVGKLVLDIVSALRYNPQPCRDVPSVGKVPAPISWGSGKRGSDSLLGAEDFHSDQYKMSIFSWYSSMTQAGGLDHESSLHHCQLAQSWAQATLRSSAELPRAPICMRRAACIVVCAERSAYSSRLHVKTTEHFSIFQLSYLVNN